MFFKIISKEGEKNLNIYKDEGKKQEFRTVCVQRFSNDFRDLKVFIKMLIAKCKNDLQVPKIEEKKYIKFIARPSCSTF